MNNHLENNMRVLITGNMGYVGPEVVKHLRAVYKNADLIGYDIGYFGSSITTNGVIPERHLDAQYFGDIRHFPDELLHGIDAIVHLAAISNDPIGNAYEEVTYEINYRSTVQLAQKARQAGVKSFVFASSCSIYGAAEDGPRKEDSALNPLTAYAKSKVKSEEGLEKLAGNDFTITCLRFSTACGMSARLRLDLVLNDFVACAVTSRKITVLSDGTPWRPLINVSDMARAIDWAINREKRIGGPFLTVNVGSEGWNCQVRDLAEAVVKVIPDVSVSINKDAPPDKRSYRVCFDLFKQLAPDHQPQIDLITSIESLKSGLDEVGFQNNEFRSSRFMRLVHLTELLNSGLLNNRLEWV
jgi:nucleoside-diphosphate-sugar epimerase